MSDEEDEILAELKKKQAELVSIVRTRFWSYAIAPPGTVLVS